MDKKKEYNLSLSTIDSKKGFEIFNIASTLNGFELINYINQHNFPINYTNQDNDNLIHYILTLENSTEIAKYDIIKLLIKNNVDIEHTNKYQQTPLHLACKLQYETVTKYLLILKANPNKQDIYGQTPTHYILKGNLITNDTTNKNKYTNIINMPNNINVKKINNIQKTKYLRLKTHHIISFISLNSTINK